MVPAMNKFLMGIYEKSLPLKYVCFFRDSILPILITIFFTFIMIAVELGYGNSMYLFSPPMKVAHNGHCPYTYIGIYN